MKNWFSRLLILLTLIVPQASHALSGVYLASRVSLQGHNMDDDTFSITIDGKEVCRKPNAKDVTVVITQTSWPLEQAQHEMQMPDVKRYVSVDQATCSIKAASAPVDPQATIAALKKENAALNAQLSNCPGFKNGAVNNSNAADLEKVKSAIQDTQGTQNSQEIQSDLQNASKAK